MRLSRALACALPAVLLCAAPAAAAKKQYYLSLGDSLSVGVQPGPAGDPGHEPALANTTQGYSEQLYALAKRRYPDLRLVKAGCGGATTQTFLAGGVDATTDASCNPVRQLPYASTSPRTSQLAYAERFLRAHRGRVAFVTVEIGNNHLDGCATATGIDLACVTAGRAQIGRNLPTIAGRLRRAAGPRVPIAGATFYDPFLQSWLTGETGQGLAGASQTLAQQVNEKTVIPAYTAAGVRLARIDQAFSRTRRCRRPARMGCPSRSPASAD